MKKVVELIEEVAPSKATVLITGESGTGKEVVARAIHSLSPRSNGPFVPINCAAMPQTLMESELFGHEKGAFTGALERRAGCFELAQSGTLLLDEIGDMPIASQAKLLRVLEDSHVRRLGGKSEILVDVRVIASTNKVLEEALKKGEVREDLFYRLNVIRFYVPPLRERRPDIPLLVNHFLNRFCSANSRPVVPQFAPEALDALTRHDWPGNVRELKNAVERAIIMSKMEVMDLSVLPDSVKRRAPMIFAPREVWTWEWYKQIPRIIGYFSVYAVLGGRRKERMREAGQIAGYVGSSTFFNRREHISGALTRWSMDPSRSFRPYFGPDAEIPGAVHPRDYNYDEFEFKFRAELAELGCAVSSALPIIAPLCAGELRLVRALPGPQRDTLVQRTIQREEAFGRTVFAAYYSDSVSGDDSEAPSICTWIADKSGMGVLSPQTIVAPFTDRRGVLVINGFCPPDKEDDDEWRSLRRIFNRVRVYAPVVLFQAADPCHSPALATTSTSVAFTTPDPTISVPAVSWERVRVELRPCCRRVLHRDQFDLAETCVQELLLSNILRKDAGVIMLDPALPEAARKGEAGV